jgi:hypothetical protein
MESEIKKIKVKRKTGAKAREKIRYKDNVNAP